MSAKARIASFALVLAAAFALAFGLGSGVEPAETGAGSDHGEATRADPASPNHEETESMSETKTTVGHGEQPATANATAGLSVSGGGYTLRLDPAFLASGEPQELSFRIADADGKAVTDFDRLHEREMHLIVVRRDGAHFQHLHPEIDATGTWTAALELPAAGVYRAFADFSVDGAAQTLATDLFSPGAFDPRPFPASTPVDEVSGYEVRLADTTLSAQGASALRFLVTEDGSDVTDIENHLGAKGHLVALREGDLAFLHVHPDEPAAEDGHSSAEGHSHAEEGVAPNVIPYTATFPTPGRYRLYLQFRHGGQVRTAQFTVSVTR